jgi:predicted alpha/beta-fold hydrolase
MTPDGDRVAVDSVDTGTDASTGARETGGTAAPGTPSPAPTVILLHGLEGSSQGHYARSVMAAVAARGWQGRVIHWRGCGGLGNLAPRAYHSGDSTELDWMLERAVAEAGGPVCVVGISLGGNVLVKWLGEQGEAAAGRVRAAVAVSVPWSLAAGAQTLARGFGRIYTRHFLATMRPKALALLDRHPGCLDRTRLLAADTLEAFDDCFTAPLHGYGSARAYYAQASAGRFVGSVRIPTLLVSARNDPFLPAGHLPDPARLPDPVRALYTDQGGHAGFCEGMLPGRLDWLPAVLLHFIAPHFDAPRVTAHEPARRDLQGL